jgi:hypothetical protein
VLLEFSSLLRIANAREFFQEERGTISGTKGTSAHNCMDYPPRNLVKAMTS